jgi:hypothetical protein
VAWRGERGSGAGGLDGGVFRGACRGADVAAWLAGQIAEPGVRLAAAYVLVFSVSCWSSHWRAC